MDNLLLQARVVADPIKNPLIGWWQEYYFFYVKHRDLEDREEFQQMMLQQDWLSTNVDANAAVANHYFGGLNGNGEINWVDHCLRRVTEEFFRDEGELWNIALLDGLPLAKLTGKTWVDSLRQDVNMPGELDVDVDLNADSTITAGEVGEAMRQWEFMRQANLTEMSYEDFLATYGVRPSKVELHRPELVRFMRNWTYPVNTIDPADGSPSSALSWAIAERADKQRFFAEPGFIFGCSVTRPKVYLSKQVGTVTAVMNNAFAWLPAVLQGDPFTSMRHIEMGKGPVPTAVDTGGYWFDIRDLFLYGEQFINFALNAGAYSDVALPATDLQKDYASGTDADGLFAGANKLIRQDGIVSLSIRGHQRDTT